MNVLHVELFHASVHMITEGNFPMFLFKYWEPYAQISRKHFIIPILSEGKEKSAVRLSSLSNSLRYQSCTPHE